MHNNYIFVKLTFLLNLSPIRNRFEVYLSTVYSLLLKVVGVDFFIYKNKEIIGDEELSFPNVVLIKWEEKNMEEKSVGRKINNKKIHRCIRHTQ